MCRTVMLNFFENKEHSQISDSGRYKILILSLVISHLDDCNDIVFRISERELQKLQRIQNICAKLVLQRGNHDSSKDALFELHLVPFKARINFKIPCKMYNCFIGNAPVYLTELLHKPVLKRPKTQIC